jgi:hypothetical protein
VSEPAADSKIVAPAGSAAFDKTVLHVVMPHVLDTLKREPALAITLAYLLVALAGIYFNVSYYDEFGIPILTLSQISDYLVAGLQRPLALVLALSTFPLVWGIDRLNARRRRRDVGRREQLLSRGPPTGFDRMRLRWYTRPRWVAACGYLIIVFFYGWLFVSKYAHFEAKDVRAGVAAQVRVALNTPAASPQSVDLSQPVVYLGAVTNYVFVYDPRSRHSAVLPVNNISRIEPIDSGLDDRPHVTIVPIP